jgi:hypothetical protein
MVKYTIFHYGFIDIIYRSFVQFLEFRQSIVLGDFPQFNDTFWKGCLEDEESRLQFVFGYGFAEIFVHIRGQSIVLEDNPQPNISRKYLSTFVDSRLFWRIIHSLIYDGLCYLSYDIYFLQITKWSK